MGLVKSLVASSIAAAFVVGGGVLASPVASAKPLSSCDPNSSVMTIDGTQSMQITHLAKYEVAPGARRGTADITQVAKLEARVTATVGGEVSAPAVIAAAAALAGTSLAAVGEVAEADAENVDVRISPESRQRYFAAFAARRVWSGTYAVSACNAAGTSVSTVKAGTWTSFSLVPLDSDSALCAVGKTDRTAAYEVGSAPYLACRSTWWS
jgi:hypothetical protein